MKQIKVVLAILMLTVLLLGGCGNSKSHYGTTVAATYGDRTIYLDEANFWLRASEIGASQYASLYAQVYGIDYWTMDSGRRTQTVAESLKEDLMAEFRQIHILLDHASEYDTTLTQEDLEKIDSTIAEMKSVYGSALFSENVIGNFSDEKLKESLITRSQALKVWHGVREQALTTVTDDECKSFTVQFFRMSDTTSIKDNELTLTGKAIADLLENALKEGKTFDELKESYDSLYFETKSFRRNDTETDTELFRVARDMTKGQVRQFTDSSSGSNIYYVVECVSEEDDEAAAAAREALESVQKEAHFNEILAHWQKDAKNFSVKGAFTSLPLPGGN
ncbi:MAG: hypothetical protein J6H18_00765 [Lachnospiraceae bacterium]|nr:hypothetical protein [Lachnospiraceae bacterium]